MLWIVLRTLEGGGKEVDVVALILGDLLQVGVEGRVEASVGKLLLGELLQTLAVEGVLEVLKGQSVVEDGG